ncbi:MAG: Glycosyl transferase, group 1 [Parcubacteria group bacterium GW2011_GWF2_39_13b]|nr:MAG: Glycosyl transferase, group 1 [Parcubacteria group bacterium GW2011_GWF2_39_13b]
MDKENKKLKIAMICDAIAYKNGASMSTIRFAEGLREKGHEIIFFADRSPQHPNYNGEFLGFKIYRFFSLLMPKGDGLYRVSFPGRKKFEKLFREHQVDIVHVFLPVPSTISAIRAARKCGLPVVAHSHAQPENLFLHIPRPIAFMIPAFSYLFDRYMGWIYKNADVVIYPSEFARKYFPKINKIKKNIVVSNGINTQVFKKTSEEEVKNLLKKYKTPLNKIIILYFGRLHPEKDLGTLIRAMALVKEKNFNAHLIVAGMGHMDKELKKLAESLNIKNDVSFWGRVPDEEKVAAFSVADIFVLPSLAELEGMVVLEAMACGKPIIIANSPESASVYFVKNNGFLFEPKNHEELAKCLVKLIENEQLREEMGKISRELSKKYERSESVNKLQETYYSLISE